ncbi:preprotein translocase subunit SecE [Zooshikella marina]|uniref:Protein translocase subunit SecE n=1 Tax=Zooshikella ganghwensis TaxID=202772 RepID=A0A4P9VWN1_9GAMM|nr:preprotein translocase subunit SecE [Zooshikella ganghwensis]MBU2706562.1 preprotein translocase subunit SecE [Zooshikella ganghwensis]RDH46832.1 preprotein translocase subunit SecE [Zooshikella ganghwensis]
MSSKAESDNSNQSGSAKTLDGLKWCLVVIIVGVGVYGNHYFAKYYEQFLLYRVLGLLVLALFAGFVAFSTEKGSRFWTLLKDAKAEIRKVVWPTRQETTQTTLIVVAAVLLVGLFLWGLDSLLSWIVNSLIG